MALRECVRGGRHDDVSMTTDRPTNGVTGKRLAFERVSPDKSTAGTLVERGLLRRSVFGQAEENWLAGRNKTSVMLKSLP